MTEAIQFRNVTDDFLPREYGPAEPKEMSDEERKIYHLEFDFASFLSQLNREDLHKKQGVVGLKAIDQAVADYIQQQVHSIFPDSDLSEDDPDNKKIQTRANNAVRFQRFVNVEKGSPEHFVLMDLVAKANRLKFSLLEDWLENSPETGFTLIAELEYRLLLPALVATDRWYIRLSREEFPIDSDERKRRGLLNECAVVREIEGGGSGSSVS